MTEKQALLVKKIKDWALKNYDKGGHWIVETFTEEEILNDFSSLKSAKEYAKILHNRQREIEAEIF